MMSRDEDTTHALIGDEMRRVFREIEKSYGRVFTFAGDGALAEFPSAIEALKCALRLQADRHRRNARLPPDQHILFRIGLNAGEIIVRQHRTGGNAVNVAARLEQLAEPGGICLSAAVHEQVRRVVAAPFAFMGARELKNIRDPVPAFALAPEHCGGWKGMPTLPRLAVARPAAPDGARTEPVEYRPSLAVLPFRTLQKDQSDAYFAEGMVDDIILALCGLKDLLVIERSSTQAFARAPLDLRRVGHELDVRYVVHGSVRRAGDRLRIAVELAEAERGQVIWSDRFDGAMDSIFDLQDRIAAQVAGSIAPHLRARELSRAVRKRPDSMTAYDLTLRALELLHMMEQPSLAEAVRLLHRAIALDPGYALAYTRLAAVHVRFLGQGWADDEGAHRDAARIAAAMAIERDPNDAMALAIHGHQQSYLHRNYQAGFEWLERAIAAGPSCAFAWSYSGAVCGYLGRHDDAVKRAEHAVRLSPLGPDAFWHEHLLSQAHYLKGQFDDAIGWARMSKAHNPANAANLRVLIASLVAVGDRPEARHAAAHLMRIVPTFRLSAFTARTPLPGDVRTVFTDRLREAGLQD